MGGKVDVSIVIEGLENYITSANQMVDSGEYIELMGLETRVSQLCRAISTLPIDNASEYADRVDEMMVSLEILQKKMQDHQDKIKQELKGLAINKQAANAYVRSDSMLPPISNIDYDVE